jgi:polyamine oxidase
MERVTGRPIVVAFHSGSVAEKLETMSDDAIVAEAMSTLTTIYA